MRYLLLLLFLLPQVICAQRAYKPVRSDLKAKNYKEAVNKLEALKKDTVQNLRDEPQTALYLIEAYRGLNDQENVKLYLHQPYDTTAFFSTTYRIVSEAVRLDSLERLKVAQSGGRLKSAALVRDLVQRYFPNILAASSFYYFSRRFEKAMPFLRMSLDLPRHPVGVMAALNSRHDTVNAVRYTSSAYILGLDDEVKRYSEMALADPRRVQPS